MIGQVVGKYRIAEQIGEGGMGMVYRAEHVLLGSPAAVKVLLPRWTRNRQIVDRFFTEARAASSIRHVNIVQVFDSGLLANGQAYIAMELLEGMSLGELLQRDRVLAPPLAAAIAGQILAALDAAHVCGVIHRDLKPDNVQLVRDASAPAQLRAKLLDFGIAKLLLGEHAGRRAITSGGVLLGTPTYMSPEQCQGRAVDSRSDLYAAGCILFEMLTGAPPFEGETNQDLVSLHIHYPPPSLRDVNASMPVELDQLITRMLAKDPERRAPSAAWSLAHLERVPLEPVTSTPQLPEPRRYALAPNLPAAALAVVLPDAPLAVPRGRELRQQAGAAGASGSMPALGAGASGSFSRISAQMGAAVPRSLRVPLIIITVAVLIALAAIVVIAQSGDLPAPLPHPPQPQP